MILFVGAIDTDAGKSLVTGLVARFRARQGRRVATQKLAQTGCACEEADDVRRHRRIMGVDWMEADRAGDTCPYIFPLAASPHLAAEAAGRVIDPAVITAATERLCAAYDDVIIEGVGGLCVPLTRELLLVDYVSERGYRTVLVSSARLGSINHTLMSIAVLHARGVEVAGVIYNRFFDGEPAVAKDSREVFRRALQVHAYPDVVIDVPAIEGERYPDIDFGELFEQ